MGYGVVLYSLTFAISLYGNYSKFLLEDGGFDFILRIWMLGILLTFRKNTHTAYTEFQVIRIITSFEGRPLDYELMV